MSGLTDISHCFTRINVQNIKQISEKDFLFDLSIMVWLVDDSNSDSRSRYIKVKSILSKARTEQSPSSFYCLIKMIFICTVPNLTVLFVHSGRHLKAGEGSK